MACAHHNNVAARIHRNSFGGIEGAGGGAVKFDAPNLESGRAIVFDGANVRVAHRGLAATGHDHIAQTVNGDSTSLIEAARQGIVKTAVPDFSTGGTVILDRAYIHAADDIAAVTGDHNMSVRIGRSGESCVITIGRPVVGRTPKDGPGYAIDFIGDDVVVDTVGRAARDKQIARAVERALIGGARRNIAIWYGITGVHGVGALRPHHGLRQCLWNTGQEQYESKSNGDPAGARQTCRLRVSHNIDRQFTSCVMSPTVQLSQFGPSTWRKLCVSCGLRRRPITARSSTSARDST